jgi:hypothetical protein
LDLGVVVVHNEDEMFQLKGALTQWYRPLRVLLDSGVQTLMLGKSIVDGFGFIDA